MTISEIQDGLEAVQNELMIISETTTAVEASLAEEILSPDKLMWALVGIIRSIDKAVQDVGALVNGAIEVRGVLDKL